MSKIDEFFNVEEIELSSEESEKILNPIVHHPNIKENALDDYHSTRESMKTMIDKGTEMIDDLMKVTKESESPRSYEVLAGYMKTISEMNKSLMEIHKDTKTITEEKNNPHQETNNFVYVGSTEDLQKKLEE